MTDSAPAPDAVVLRCFDRTADYDACVELQRRTWGSDFSDVTPGSILKISQKVGGLSAGAFAPDGRLLAFLYGLTGLRHGKPIHWSHMMAVAPEARDLGLGTRLKLFQREFLLAQGVEEVEWTFDPLEARNAHLNFNHLGAEVAEYVENMYEGETGSDLWEGIGTDRLILVWRIASERVSQALVDRRHTASDPFRAAPMVNEGNGIPDSAPELPRLRLEVPESIQDLKSDDPEQAAAWRSSTRWAFETYLARGYRVEAFYRDRASRRCFYCLESSGTVA